MSEGVPELPGRPATRVLRCTLREGCLLAATVTALLIGLTILRADWWGESTTPGPKEFWDLPTKGTYSLILLPLVGLLLLIHPTQRFFHALGVPWRSLSAGFLLGILLVPTLLLAELTGSFSNGLFVSAAIAGMTGYVIAYRGGLSFRGCSSGTVIAGWRRWPPRAAMLVVVLTFFGPQTQFQFWDHIGQEGRYAMQNALLFGKYPPSSFSLPNEALIYHYGFDATVAAFALIFRLPLDASLSTVALLSLLWLLVLARQTAHSLGAGVAGQCAAVVVVPLFGGLPYYVGTASSTARFLEWLPYEPRHLWINPPTASYFFQRSWSIGLPLVLTIVALTMAVERAGNHGRRYQISLASIIAVLLAMLSITNITAYFVSLGGLIVVGILTLLYPDALATGRSSAQTHLGAAVGSLPLALALGGMTPLLLRGQGGGGSHFALRFMGQYPEPLQFVTWLAFSCGVVLLLAPWVFRQTWPTSLFPASLTAVGLTIPFGGYYTGSTDITKFLVIPVVVVALFSATTFDRQLKERSPLRLVTALALAVGCSASITFLFPLVRDSIPNLNWPTGFTRPASGPVLASEVAKRLLPTGRSVACSPELVGYCGTYGGFPQLNPDVLTRVQGGHENTVLQQDAWMANLPVDFVKLTRTGVMLLIIGPASTVWQPRVTDWSERGIVELVVDFDGFQLWRFRGTAPAG